MNEKILSLAIMAKDEASASINKITQTLGSMTEKMNLAERAGGALHDVLRGIGMGLGFDAFNQIAEVFSRIAQAIPDLVTKGLQYAETIHKIGQETGASAETSSIFLGSLTFLGISTDSASQKLAIFSTNVIKHEQALNAMGIATRASDGSLLDQITLLDNVRHGLQGMADGTAKTALEQQLLGRSSQELAPFLNMTDQQAQLLGQHLQDTGQVMGEDTVGAAKKASLALNDLGGMIQGIANELIANVGPGLEQAVEAIGGFIHDNMTSIVNFAQSAIGFVLSLIGQLLGKDLSMPAFVDSWAAAGTAASGAGAAMVQAAGAGSNAVANATQTLQDQAAFTKGQTGEVSKLEAAWKAQHGSGAAGAKAEKSAIDDEVKSIDAQIAAIKTLDTNQNLSFSNVIRNITAQLAAETRQLDTQDAIAQKQQRDVSLQRQIGDATDQLTTAEDRLAEAKNKVYAPDLEQRALDERQYTLDLAQANQSLADANARLANEPAGTSGDQMAADQLAAQQAQLSIDQLTHARASAVAQQITDDKQAAAAQIQAVNDATTQVNAAQSSVNDLKLQQTTNAIQDAEDAKRAEIQTTQDKLTAIAGDEQNWTDKKGYLAKVQADQASIQSQIETAKKSGDVQKVHDLTILLQGLQTIETHVQEEMRNTNEETALTNQKTRLEELKASVAAATTGSPGGIAPKFAVAGVQATASVSTLATNAIGSMSDIALGVGIAGDKIPTTPAGAIGLLSDSVNGKGPNSLASSFAGGEAAGKSMATTLQGVFKTLGTAVGGVVDLVSTLSTTIGKIENDKVGLGYGLIALGIATGQPEIVLAGITLAGIGKLQSMDAGTGQAVLNASGLPNPGGMLTGPLTVAGALANSLGLTHPPTATNPTWDHGTSVSHHAAGGWVGQNGPELSWVGEQGPEYIHPAGTGTGGDVHNHTWNVSLPSVTNSRQFLREVERLMTKNNITSLQQR